MKNLAFKETHQNACTQLHIRFERKCWGNCYQKIKLHAKNILHLLIATSSFSSVLLLYSSAHNFFFFISCISLFVFSLFSSHAPNNPSAISWFALLGYTFSYVRLCNGIMCVQSTIVPLSRAGKHTIWESAVCTRMSRKRRSKKRTRPTNA